MALQVWLPLNGDLHNQGLSNAEIVTTGATINTSGKIGSCYSFDGSDDLISISCPDLYKTFSGGSQQFSVAFWVYHADSTRAIIFGDYGLTGTISFNIELTTGHQVRFYWNGSPDKNFAAAAAVAASNWTHIVLTYDGSKLNIYKNGILQSDSWSGVLTTKNKTSGLFYLGRDSRTGTTALNGRLNDFRIYNHALSVKEIEELAKGLVIHYKLNLNQYDNNLVTSLTAGGQTSVSNGIVTTSGTNADTYFTINLSENIVEGTSYIISCDGEDIPDGTCWTFPIGWQGNTGLSFQIYNGHNSYCFTANSGSWGTKRIFMDDGGSPNSARYTGVSTKIKNFFVSKINTLIDYSGYNNSGIINDISAKYINDSARYDTSLYHTQANNSAIYLAKGDCNIPESTNLTFAWWMKPTQWGAQTSGLWSTSANGASTDYNTTAANMRDSYFDCCNVSGSCKRVEAASMVTLNEWHHYALTYDGTNLKIYKDGIQKTSTAQTGALKAFTNIFLFYSKAGGVNRNTSGYINDFRVYVTTLTAEQLLELYNTSATIDKSGNVYARELIE